MNKPTNKYERLLEVRAWVTEVETDITKRWEEGTPHHPESVRLSHEIAAIDWLWGGDGFCWKFGGDGDNGETLQYLLDIIMEIRDVEESVK